MHDHPGEGPVGSHRRVERRLRTLQVEGCINVSEFIKTDSWYDEEEGDTIVPF